MNSNTSPLSALQAATLYHQSGLSVIPVLADGSKQPAVAWKVYQQNMPQESDLPNWFKNGSRGVGIVTGAISGNLEVLDFDEPSMLKAWSDTVKDAGGDDLLKRLTVVVKTPTGGWHVPYRCEAPVEHNLKLAMLTPKDVAVETRGEGGYVLAPGSPASCHPSGKEYALSRGSYSDLPVLTSAERKLLLDCARKLNKVEKQAKVTAKRSTFQPKIVNELGTKNGDAFNEQMSWDDILTPHGFTLDHETDGVKYWQKPGKTGSNHQITTNHNGTDSLYCFSTAAPPFEPGIFYNKQTAFNLLNYGEDFAGQGKQLASRKEGRWFIGTERQEPTPLLRQETGGEPFPVDALGPLKDVVEICQQIDQAPISVTAFSFLAAANQAVQAHADVEIDGRVSPISSFFISIAETGERKSAVDKAATIPIRRHEAQLQAIYDQKLAEYNLEIEAYNAERKNILAGKKSKEEIEGALKALGEPPLAPLQPDILVSDPTFEGLCKQLYIGRPSAGIFADEGAIFLGGYSMKEDEAVRTGAGLSNFWDGKTLNRVRASAETFKLPGRRLSMHLLIQPAIAPMLLGNPLLKGQGFLSRCLVASASNVENRTYVERDLTQETAYKAYLSQMLIILSRDLPIADKKKNALKPRALLLAPEAKLLYIEYHDAIQKQMGKGQLLNPVKGLAAKAHDLASRIAATLALYEDIDQSLIQVAHMQSGIDITTFCLTEALRLFEAAPADESLSQAETLLQWLNECGERAISLVEIYQNGPSFVRSASKARELLSILWRHGHLVRSDESVDFAGGIRREVFRVCH